MSIRLMMNCMLGQCGSRFAVALLVGSMTIAGCSANAPEGSTGSQVPSLEGRTLVSGVDATYPPFEYVDASGKTIGFGVDLADAICERIQCTVEFQTAEWDGIFDALAANEFDIVLSSATITSERSQVVDFTRPYLRAGQVITVRSDSTITNIDDAKSEIVGALEGSTSDLPGFDTKTYETLAAAMQGLINGEVAATLGEAIPSLTLVSRDYPGELKVLNQPFTTEYYGIAVPKSAVDVREAFDIAITQLDEDGTLEALATKWKIPGRAIDDLPDEPTFPR
ncbi:MAG: ABC transporter substrate-binding protein [Cyanobacteria bacterium J06642_2]